MPNKRAAPRRRGVGLRLACVAPSLAAALAGPPARAQGDADPFELSPEDLFSATVISATKSRDAWWDTPAAAFVLGGEEIARSGATSIPEALRLVPGVQVARVNASTWAISARGFNGDLANKLLVLIDGREVYNHLFSGVYWDAQDVMLEDVERIEVIRGPGAALWGANAVNGVINVITKRAAETRGVALALLGGNEEAAGALRYGGEALGGGHYRVFGKGLWRDAQRAQGGGGGGDAWRAGRLGFRADWERGGGAGFTLQGDGFHGEADHRRSVPLLVAPYAATADETLHASGGNLLARWTRELGAGGRLALQTYADYSRRRARLLDEDVVALDVDAQLETQPWRRLGVTLGAGYRYAFSELTGSAQATVTEPERRDQVYSAFAQGELALLPERLFFTLGTKLEHNDYSGFEVQPSARLRWLPGERHVLWSAVSRAVRRPNRLEHDLEAQLATLPPSVLPLPVSVVLEPNDGFDREELIAYELGYRGRWHPALLVAVAAFHNDYDALATNALRAPAVVNDGVNPPYVRLPVAITNDTEARAQGVEAVASWRARESLQLSLSYAYLRLALDGPPPDVAIDAEGAEGRSPRHEVGLRSQWDVTERVSLDAAVSFTGALPALQLGEAWRLDLRAGWRFAPRLALELVGQNLLDGARREFGAPGDVAATEAQRAGFLRLRWQR